MGRPERRRRLAIIAVMLLTTWALLATSPPMEPIQEVHDVDRVELALGENAPVATVSFVVSASDESLWSDDAEITPTSGTLTLEAHVPQPAASPASSSAVTGASPILGVRLLRQGAEVGSHPDFSAVDPSSVTFDLRAACLEDRDCELELEAVVEWLNPEGGELLAAELVITARASIEGPETVPVGAEIALAVDAARTPDVTVVGDAAGSAPVQLDVERPMVTWSLDASANPEALSQPITWPIDAHAVLSLDIAVPNVPPDEYRYREPPVRLLLVVAGQEMPLRPAGGNLQHELPLFRCGTGPCDERVTLVAQWEGRSADEAVTLGWDLEAGLTFHEPATPVDGAAVRLSEPVRTDIHRGGPSVNATVEGSIPLFDENDPVRVRNVRIDVPAGALASERIGGPVPAVLAHVTASSTSSQPIPDDALIRLRSGEVEGQVPFPSQPAASWTAWAAPECRADGHCSAEFGLGASAYRQGGGNLDGSDLVVHWQVEIILVYPRGTTIPAGAGIDLAVTRP